MAKCNRAMTHAAAIKEGGGGLEGRSISMKNISEFL